MNAAGTHAASSYYAATANPIANFGQLQSDLRTDVCVIGAGYTGLSAALHLAQRGYQVVVLEAETIGHGASGRNGGQCAIGQRLPQDELEARFGRNRAATLWNLSFEAVGTVRALIERYDIRCDLKRGLLQLARKESAARWYRRYAAHLQHHYGTACRFIEGEELAELSGSTVFHGGLIEQESAHLHPLNYCLGLAQAAYSEGVTIFESSRVQHYDRRSPCRVRTRLGSVTADFVVLACNAYLGRLESRISGQIMPINNFMVATEILDEPLRRCLNPQDLAMHDSRFVVNYWKLSGDGRLLFGGGESYRRRLPTNIERIVSPRMLEIFPQLSKVRIEYSWGGKLALTMHRFPCFGHLKPGIYYAMGFSGHGIQTATLAGKLIAEAVAGSAERFDVMARLPTPRFPGGTILRWPGLVLGMMYYSLRDRFGG